MNDAGEFYFVNFALPMFCDEFGDVVSIASIISASYESK